MALTVEQLKKRLRFELQSMPPGGSRVAVDCLYSVLARQRDISPIDGYAAIYEVMMVCSTYWLDSSADPTSESVRLSTLEEVQDWVNWVEGRLYETSIMVAREAMPELDDEPLPSSIPEPASSSHDPSVHSKVHHVSLDKLSGVYHLMLKAQTIHGHGYYNWGRRKA